VAETATIGVLKAILQADTSQLTQALAGATADVQKLATAMQKDLLPRQQAINAAVKDFLGASEIRKAQEYVAAVQQIGGVTALTTADQLKLNKAVTDAIAQYQKLGVEAPADLVKIAEATKQVPESTNKLLAGLKEIGPALGLSFGVGAIIGFGKELIQTGSDINDMSERLGVGIEATQRFKYAADQTGASLDDVGVSLTHMNKVLSEGNTSTQAALQAVGLSLDDLRGKKPEDAFLAIAEAVGKIEDPMTQSRVALELFGRSGATLLPGIKEGFAGIAEQAPVMSEKTVHALDDIGDAIDRLYTKFKVRAATTLTGDLFQSFQDQMLELLPSDFANAVRSSATFREQLSKGQLPLPAAPSLVPTGGGALPVPGRQEQAGIDEATREAMRKSIADAEAAVRALEAYDRSIQAIADEITGKALAQKVLDLSRAIARSGETAAISWPEYQKLSKEVLGLAEQGAAVNPILYEFYATARLYQALPKDAAASVKLWSDAFKDLAVTMQAAVETSTALHDVWTGPSGTELLFLNLRALNQTGQGTMIGEGGLSAPGGAGPTNLAQLHSALGAISEDFTKLAQVADGAMSQVVRDIGRGVTAANQAVSGLTFLKKPGGINKLAGITDIVSAGLEIGTLLYQGIESAFFSHKGRDLITQFAESHGGFDALHAELDALGAEGEQLWRGLTQGTPGDDPAAAKRNIDAIKTALDKVHALQQVVAGDFDKLQTAVTDFGGAIPDALKPMIADLETMNGLTAEQKTLLESLAGDPSLDSLQRAADDLGVSFDHMGKNFQQAEISQTAFKYQHDLDELAQAGADMNAVLGDSKDKLNALVQQALATGSALPRTLEPYIRKLNELGELVGPDGLPLDISKITFADIEDTALDAIKTILEQIRDLLANQIPAAARQAADAINHVPPPPGSVGTPPPGVTPGTGGAPPLNDQGQIYPIGNGYMSDGSIDPNGPYASQLQYSAGSYGLKSFNPAGQFVQLHGAEEVLTASQSVGVATMVRDALAEASGGLGGTITLNMDGRKVGEVVLPHLPAAARRLGLSGTF